MDKVYDRLYLGALEDVFKITTMKEAGISHILSILDRSLPVSIRKQFTCKYVEVLDLPDEDLLSYFEECLRFIDEGRNNGTGVLVHCLVGCSRSATIVIAWMMRERQINVEDAVNSVKECRPRIRPNDGFKFQLELFSQMNYQVDSQNLLYKKFKLDAMVLQMQEGSNPDSIPSDLLAASPTEGQTKGETIYRCKKCRLPLFRESSLLSHLVGEGKEAFSWKSKLSNLSKMKSEEICTVSLFIEPVQWMADIVTKQDGKLSCPKCVSKLGSFIWCGEKCPCGAWVAPAFHIQKGKVDLSKPLLLAPRYVYATSST